MCTKCGKRKPLAEFGNHPRTTDGLKSHCKKCAGDVVRALRERTERAYGRWYDKAHRRALKRLAELHPVDFEALFTEELGATPRPQYERKKYERSA